MFDAFLVRINNPLIFIRSPIEVSVKLKITSNQQSNSHKRRIIYSDKGQISTLDVAGLS